MPDASRRNADPANADKGRHRPLDQLQRWLQAVITHPGGVVAGIDSAGAQTEIHVAAGEVESVIGRSLALGSLDRLAVYANAYYARLIECLREVFPVVCRTMGEEIFDNFAVGYLQKYPSHSYTLNELGARFARYLDDTRPTALEPSASEPGASESSPDDAESPDAGGAANDVDAIDDGDTPSGDLVADWPRFVVELARLEWTVGEVYDGPGIEKVETLQADDLAQLSPERWTTARLHVAPCVRLLEFGFAVNDFYTRSRELLREEADDEEESDEEENDEDNGASQQDREELPIPPPERTYLALSRRNYVVRRYPLAKVQYDLLRELAAGRSIGEALAAATADCEWSDEELATALHAWFAQWTADQFFVGVAVD